jgi:hypothetical protein
VEESDEFKLFPFTENMTLVDDPDPTHVKGEMKVVEIGPAALQVASAHGCHVTLVVDFSVRRTGSSNDFSGTFSIDSDTGPTPETASPLVRRSGSAKTAKKIAAPVVR